jgi:hypothetical protein
VDRLQIIKVVSERLKDVGAWDAATMVVEAQDYAATLPSFVSMLYGGEQVNGFINQFADIAPGFMIYDVGRPHRPEQHWMKSLIGSKVFQSFVPEVVTATLQSLKKPMPALLGFCPCNGAACYKWVKLRATRQCQTDVLPL